MSIKAVATGAFVPDNGAVVTDGQAVTVDDLSAGSAPAELAVSGGTVTGATFTQATDAIVSNGDTVDIFNQNGSEGTNGTALVAGAIAVARLPPNVAMVENGIGLSAPVTGSYVDTITPDVDANGVITGFTLS